MGRICECKTEAEGGSSVEAHSVGCLAMVPDFGFGTGTMGTSGSDKRRTRKSSLKFANENQSIIPYYLMISGACGIL